MLVGLFLLILGVKFLKVTFVITAIFASLTLMLFLLGLFNITQQYAVWIFLAILLILGVVLAYFIIGLTRLVVAILGGYLGYVLGLVLYQSIFIYVNSNPKVVYWIVIFVCIILCALAALWATKHMLIISTCFIGGYAVVRGASFYIGHFPDEKIVMDLIANEEWEQLKGVRI